MSLETQEAPPLEGWLFLVPPPLARLADSHPLSHFPLGAQGHTSNLCPKEGQPPGTQIPGPDGKLVKGVQ